MTANKHLQELGQNIRRIRKLANFSQESVALNAGLDRSYYGRIERGEVNVSVINLVKIAETLHTTIASLFGNIPQQQINLSDKSRGRSR